MEALNQRIKAYMETHARPLERALHAYHFEGGALDHVLKELKGFQNEDGGFGHGLEPDFFTPESSPIATWAAANIIRGLHINAHPMIDRMIDYLLTCPHQSHGLFHAKIKENNAYPHAPWWHYEANEINNYNPTASLLGFLCRYMNPEHLLYKSILERTQKAIDHFIDHDVTEMHELRCFVELYHDVYLNKPRDAFTEKLESLIIKTTESDHTLWFTSYCVKPSQLIINPQTPGYTQIKALVDLEHQLLLENRHQDGLWSITWDWSDNDPFAFEIAKMAWQGIIALNHLMRFKTFHFEG